MNVTLSSAMNTKVVILGLFIGVVAATRYDKSPSILTSLSSSDYAGPRIAIYHGQTTTIEKHPYLASYFFNGYPFGAATILSKKWVLTTADCCNGYSPSVMKIVSGSNDMVTGTEHSVKKVVVHPKYKPTGYEYNIALLQISDSFKWNKKTKAIKLPKKEIAVNTQVMVAGYGYNNTVYKGSSNNLLQQGNLKWLSKSECNSLYKKENFTFTETLACAYNKGKTTLCTGDWSDALVKNGVAYGIFVGCEMTGFCTSTARPGIFADLYPLTNWIKNITGIDY